MRKSKHYEGVKIIAEYDSSNIKKVIYDTSSKLMTVHFGSGVSYEYYNVPHETFSAFDVSESQGKYFNTNISKNFTYKKIILTENNDGNKE